MQTEECAGRWPWSGAWGVVEQLVHIKCDMHFDENMTAETASCEEQHSQTSNVRACLIIGTITRRFKRLAGIHLPQCYTSTDTVCTDLNHSQL